VSDWRSNTKVFYGWWQVGALFSILFFTAGSGFYVFPVFIKSFQNEFGWSMLAISGSAAVWAVVFGISGIVVGIMVAKYGARRTMLIAAALATITNLGLALLQNLWMLYAINLLAGFVVAGTTIVPGQTVVTNWFDKYRGRAMALMMLGIAAGGALLPWLNEFMIRTIGWRWAWGVGVIILWAVVIPLIAIFIRTRPSDVGLTVDGIAAKADDKPKIITGLPVKRALGTISFWLLTVSFMLQLLAMSAMNFHYVPFATQQVGFPQDQVTFYYGLAIGSSIIGRLVFGWLADKYSPVPLLAFAYLLTACGPAVLWPVYIGAEVDSLSWMWFYAVPYGIGLGGYAVVFPVLVSRCFGELYFSKLIGLVGMGFAVGIIVGIPVGGYIFDRTGSYKLVFIGCIVAVILAMVMTLLIRPERYRREFSPETPPAKVL
jgi:MFS family permease